MTCAPEVSVVMSVHNDARYLRDALSDILRQQHVDLELVVVDDGSTDESPEILRQACESDGRVRVLTQENAGLTRALIRGCESARGEYIARHDADDRSDVLRLARQLELIRSEEGLSFVSSWAEVIGPSDEPLLLHRRPADSAQATHMLLHERQGPPGHGSVMMRRSHYEKVGGYRAKFYFAQDSDLWLRLGLVGRLAYVQEPLYRYRVSAASISGRLHAQKLAYARLIDTLHAARLRGEDDERLLEEAELPPLIRGQTPDSSSHSTDHFIGRCLFARRDPRSRTYLRSAVRSGRSSPRTWLLAAAAEIAAPFWSEQRAPWA